MGFIPSYISTSSSPSPLQLGHESEGALRFIFGSGVLLELLSLKPFAKTKNVASESRPNHDGDLFSENGTTAFGCNFETVLFCFVSLFLLN